MACIIKIKDGIPTGWVSGSIKDCLEALDPRPDTDDEKIMDAIKEMESTAPIRIGKYEIIKDCWLLIG